jgi:electron transport complex protein RnfB
MTEKKSEKPSRRDFLRKTGQLACAGFLGGIVYRVFADKSFDSEDQPQTRYAWQINHDKCTYCGQCETACVRKPSAVKAVNDQKKCSFCVVCYGHITNKLIESSKIETDGKKVCPHNAVKRKNYCGGLDGYYIYSVDDKRCVGCAKCVERCNFEGNQSMFLIIRPDLCLGCNDCDIAKQCPSQAIERIHISPEDDYRGKYGSDDIDMDMGGQEFDG